MAMRLSRSIVGEAEAEAVRRVIVEDGYLGIGAEVKRFEQELASYLGVDPELVCTANTGTSAQAAPGAETSGIASTGYVTLETGSEGEAVRRLQSARWAARKTSCRLSRMRRAITPEKTDWFV